MMGFVRAFVPFALASALAAGARAHESPHGTALLWEDDAAEYPSVIVANRGLVFRDEVDGDVRLSLRCSDAYGANIADRPAVYLDAAKRLTIGMFNGVFATTDRACSTEAGSGLPENESLANLASVAGPPARLLVSTRTFTGTTAVFKSEDEGRSFSQSFRNPTDQYYDRLIAAPSDPLRVYAAGQRADRVNKQVIFLCSVSLDGGESWQDQVVPTKLLPFAVHPGNPDVVFAYQPTDLVETEYRLLRSDDRGAHFTPVLEYCAAQSDQPQQGDAGSDAGANNCTAHGMLTVPLRKPTSLALAGDVLYLGIGDAGGLYRSTDGGESFERVHADSINSVTCLVQRGERLWLCGNMAPNSNGVWFSDDGGESFEELMTFEDVTHPVMCEQLEAQVTCSRAWHDFDLELHPDNYAGDASVGPEPASDASVKPGSTDAGTSRDASTGDAADDEPEPRPRKRSSDGCQASASDAPHLPAWGAMLMFGGLFAWRRRRAMPARRVRRHG